MVVALDTNTLQRWLANDDGDDVRATAEAFSREEVLLPPVLVAEVLSNPYLTDAQRQRIIRTPMMPIRDGYWQRVGDTRAFLILLNRRPKLPDALIAQSCIDHDVPLITYDEGFRRFEYVGLKLLQ